MRKYYPFGRPGPPAKDADAKDLVQTFILEIKMHMPIVAMASGAVNRAVFGNFGEWPLQSPLPPADFARAWKCWCPNGPEVSIAWGLGAAQVKFSYFEDNLHIVPAFPTTFQENFTPRLQDLYKGAHVTVQPPRPIQWFEDLHSGSAIAHLLESSPLP
jgi:hypothetical protein